METIKVNTSQQVDIDYPVAGLGERIAARMIDFGLLIGVLLVFVLFAGLITNPKTNVFFIGLMIIYAAAYVFYHLICEIFFNGQSPGKKLMKIKVVSLDGGQASIGQYFIRWLFRLVDFWLSGQVGGLLCVALSEHKQRIGDLVAGTTVIKTVGRTTLEEIAFEPVEEEYIPVFANVHLLNDQEMELIHEVLTTYYKTAHYELIYAMADKIKMRLGISLPAGMHELAFLNTVVKDYNQVTSVAQ
ncbi:putative RDD family membrane protein YckC [Pedobacter cryoconitis]|uniref:Putative RDD family membrane protein YckC n=1 Tax=Pedobacter cryoconitis TaxID=188932 RepID=A0A7W9DZ51_9SPHI|nr:RDD family protein [Pedobacter cryoconitis]MBB5635904.1 putative RDD family membrane protein YckC [Pedobacter cryoconitis]